jgi:electron transport complex protein RnfB
MIEVGRDLRSWKWDLPTPPVRLIATDREQAA